MDNASAPDLLPPQNRIAVARRAAAWSIDFALVLVAAYAIGVHTVHRITGAWDNAPELGLSGWQIITGDGSAIGKAGHVATALWHQVVTAVIQGFFVLACTTFLYHWSTLALAGRTLGKAVAGLRITPALPRGPPPARWSPPSPTWAASPSPAVCSSPGTWSGRCSPGSAPWRSSGSTPWRSTRAARWPTGWRARRSSRRSSRRGRPRTVRPARSPGPRGSPRPCLPCPGTSPNQAGRHERWLPWRGTRRHACVSCAFRCASRIGCAAGGGTCVP